MNILFLTKTNWDEPPRIRHQLANLLIECGHNIIFVEKPSLKNLFSSKSKIVNNSLKLISHGELFHHQLRPFSILQYLNFLYINNVLNSLIDVESIDLVFNFNYDYSRVIKSLNKPCITVINDDFVAQGKPWMKRAINKQTKEVCKVSDYTLGVSYPIVEWLKNYTDRVELFLPWAPDEYLYPEKDKKRDVVLYFGYVSRIDWGLLENLLENKIKLRVVGPANRSSIDKLDELKSKYSTLEVYGQTDFSKLDTNDVFCSIAPYDLNIENSFKITANNRMFRLLSRGIPLIIPNLPSLITAPNNVIYTYNNKREFIEGVKLFYNDFYKVQSEIKSFLNGHYLIDRIDSINILINRININETNHSRS